MHPKHSIEALLLEKYVSINVCARFIEIKFHGELNQQHKERNEGHVLFRCELFTYKLKNLHEHMQHAFLIKSGPPPKQD